MEENKESRNRHTYISNRLFFYQGVTTIQWETYSFQQMTLHRFKKNKRPCLKIYTEINYHHRSKGKYKIKSFY